MEIKITGIGDKGDLNNERIGITVLKDCELKYFLVVKVDLTDGGFYHKSKNIYWFLPQPVKAGDNIVLYTKSGSGSIEEKKDGSKTYFYYWGLNESLFSNNNQGVVLVQAKDWQLSRNI